jgi:hypothetical protein
MSAAAPGQTKVFAAGFDLGGSSQLVSSFGTVTSAIRTAAHNKAVGGMPNSYHLVGRAIDVARRPGVSHARLESELRRAGYILVESIDEGDHSHFAFDQVRTLVVAKSESTAQRVSGTGVIPKALVPPPVSLWAADHHGELLIDVAVAKPTLGGDVDKIVSVADPVNGR